MIIVDYRQWILGTMSFAYAKYLPDDDVTVLSTHLLTAFFRRYGLSFSDFDLVHMMSPYLNKVYLEEVMKQSACLTTVHHILEEKNSVWGIERADGVLTFSRRYQEAVLQRGVRGDRLHVLPHGIDGRVFYRLDDDERKRKRHAIGVDENDFVIGFFGKASSNKDDRKGISRFTRLIKLLLKEETAVVPLIVGPGWGSLISELRQLTSKVVWIPWAEDAVEVADHARLLDLYWVTADIEGGPVPMYEAMACGVPVLSTPVGAADERIISGQNGWLIPFEEDGQFVEYSKVLIQDRTKARQMGEDASQMMESEFEWSKIAPRMNGIYAQVLQQAQDRGMTFKSHCKRISPLANRVWMKTEDEMMFAEALIRMGESQAGRKRMRRTIYKAWWRSSFYVRYLQQFT